MNDDGLVTITMGKDTAMLVAAACAAIIDDDSTPKVESL